MELFDSHAHLPETFDGDIDSYVKRATDACVSKIVLLGNGKSECDLLADLSVRKRNLYFAAGIHPHDAQGTDLSVIDGFESYAALPHCAAIGEIGLDYYYDFSPRSLQIPLLERQLALALELNLPAVIHCRDKADTNAAYDDAYALLKSFSEAGGRFVMHSYAGTISDYERFLELGAYFGVVGMITFRKADNIRELAGLYPEERIMLETDSPYLTPVPFRGQENHPAYLQLTAQKLSEIRGWTPEYTAELTTANAKRFFGIQDYV